MQFIDHFLTELCQTFWSKCSKSCLNQFGLLLFHLFRSLTRADVPLQLLLGKRMAAVALLGCHGAGCQVCMQLPAARPWGTAHSIMFYMRFCGTKIYNSSVFPTWNHVSWKERFRCAEIFQMIDVGSKTTLPLLLPGSINVSMGEIWEKAAFVISPKNPQASHICRTQVAFWSTLFVNLILHWQKKKGIFPSAIHWDTMRPYGTSGVFIQS